MVYSMDVSVVLAPECPSPWIPLLSKCYLFSETPLPWLDAQIACDVSMSAHVARYHIDSHRPLCESVLLVGDSMTALLPNLVEIWSHVGQR